MKRRLGFDNQSPMANGIRLRNDHLTLEHRPGKPMLRSIGKATHHLAKMGVRRAHGDFLRIEEALYLAELGAAVVLNQNRAPLTIPHLFSLMCSMNVSLFKYAVYAQLVRAGYVVRRPSDTAVTDDASSSTSYAVKACAFHFPQRLLDQVFLLNGNVQKISLHLPPIQRVHEDNHGTVAMKATLLNKNGIDGGGVDDDDEKLCITLDNLNVTMHEHIRKNEQFLLRDVRRQHSEPWNICRPRWWPSLRSLHDLDSWRVYALRREALLLQKRRHQNNRQPTTAQSFNDSCFAYELFPDERASTKPIYSVIIIEPFSIAGASAQPNFALLHKLATDCRSHGTQLLLATGTPSCVRINQFIVESDESLRVPQDVP
ncbi:hypothetical protein niasHT_035591 [Heterodera trifolii]|uniref:tRNA-splicing endonuclease subunit Sen54 N-terminal domain-containing protein n=1 Tax=Heterodera trifolii TaxID=157864 RepID=A0ABD2IXD9_9BILA